MLMQYEKHHISLIGVSSVETKVIIYSVSFKIKYYNLVCQWVGYVLPLFESQVY